MVDLENSPGTDGWTHPNDLIMPFIASQEEQDLRAGSPDGAGFSTLPHIPRCPYSPDLGFALLPPAIEPASASAMPPMPEADKCRILFPSAYALTP